MDFSGILLLLLLLFVVAALSRLHVLFRNGSSS